MLVLFEDFKLLFFFNEKQKGFPLYIVILAFSGREGTQTVKVFICQ